MNSINKTVKPGKADSAKPARLLDRVREQIRYRHYSIRTEQAYVYWVKFFIRWHKLRHPAEMGRAEVEGFLTYLADTRGVSASAHRQALSALLFLYKDVLQIELPWMTEIGRPQGRRRVPVVLTRQELQAIFVRLEGEVALVCRLLYGTGMRLMEAPD